MTGVEVSKQANWASARNNVTIGSQDGGIDGGQWQIPMPHLITEGIMEDPQYYQLRNYALDFLYNRFAHDDDAA